MAFPVVLMIGGDLERGPSQPSSAVVIPFTLPPDNLHNPKEAQIEFLFGFNSLTQRNPRRC